MIGKYVVILLLAVVLATNALVITSSSDNILSGNQSHHLIIGAREYGDQQVHQERVTKSSSWLQIEKIEKTITIHGANKITQIQALDQKTNGNGAFVTVLSGGPGYNFVSLKFKSQRSHGIDFNVLIFAK